MKYLLAIFFLVWALPLQAEVPTLRNYTIEQQSKHQRVILSFTSEVEFRLFTLSDPERIVVDVPGAQWGIPPGNHMQKQQNLVSDTIKRLRYGQPKPGTLRVALDVVAPQKIEDAYLRFPPDFQGYYDLILTLSAGPTNEKPSLLVDAAEPDSKLEKQEVIKPEAVKKAEKSLPKPKPKPFRPVIVIDPGHGGYDPGAIGKTRNIKEKEITLEYALALKRLLEKDGRYHVLLTRSGDYFVPLKKRVEKARATRADLFISLHADSCPDEKVRGLSVYTLSEEASDKEAGQLAARENKRDIIYHVDFKDTSEDVKEALIGMVRRDTQNRSAQFAEKLVQTLSEQVNLVNNTHRFAGFLVLKGIDMPSVLVELGYLSHTEEEQLLLTKSYRQTLVHALKGSIEGFFYPEAMLEQAEK